MFAGLRKISTFASAIAEIAQLVEHNLAKVRVASSSLVFRSLFPFFRMLEWWNGRHEGLKILWPLRLCGFKSRFEYSKGRIVFSTVRPFSFISVIRWI